MRPTKLSANVFLELPPILSHYVEADRHLWIDGNPKRGRLRMLNRAGNFCDLEAVAVERRNQLALLGRERHRALLYRTGFEQGRRDALRHLDTFNKNTRLALQAALVFGQLQGRFVAEPGTFEFDLEAGTLERDLRLTSSAEAVIQGMVLPDSGECTCWNTAGYLSGHVSEILGCRIATLETACISAGADACQFISRIDTEFGSEADWTRAALRAENLDVEIKKRDMLIKKAQSAALSAQSKLSTLNRRMRSDLALETLAADSEVMAPVAQRVRQLMVTDAPVLIAGEPGTGKETVARTIHDGGARRKNAFIEVDCSEKAAGQLEQELFGYEKDAFSGATLRHTGAYVRGDGGTLFLHHIDQMTPEIQVQLLKTLELGAVQPLGAQESVNADVRLIVGTDDDPQEAHDRGQICDELFCALSVGHVDVPPLRERKTDILRLTQEFLREFQKRYDRGSISMSPDFKVALMNCGWPGNVRQLRDVVEHAVIMSSGGELTAVDLPEEVLAGRWSRQPGDLTEEVIRATLSRTHNNRTKAAQLLGVGRTTLWRSMKRYGIE